MFGSKIGSKFESKFEPTTLERTTFERTSLVPMPKSSRALLSALPERQPGEGRQRRLMVGALALLLVALSLLLYKDREFWFPDDSEADELLSPPAAAADQTTPTSPALVVATTTPKGSKRPTSKLQAKDAAPAAAPAEAAANVPLPPITTTTRRTVLPPLEVEVVAGDVHRTVHPGTNSVHVDLQPGAPTQPVSEPASGAIADTAAGVTSNAAERVQMSADTAEVVSRPVKPGYPLLARQMKVQGSVILQALIGKDGLIQDLRVLSGPPILSGAAEEAVRQWHFKPHYQGAEAVETQARITVNFTISTN
jgi:TonB family protein